MTPTVGRFKKGAFRMAMDADVPVVPIVLRNSGELMWRDSRIARSGTIEVAVHPPIHVADWALDELDKRVAEVRDLYVQTLENWPDGAKETGSRRSEAKTRFGTAGAPAPSPAASSREI